MASKHKQGPQDNSAENGEVYALLGVVILVLIFWFTFRVKFVTGFFFVKNLEAAVIGLFTDNLGEIRRWMALKPKKEVEAGDLLTIATQVGSYIRFVSGPVLLAIGFWLMKKSPTERFRRKFTDRTLPITEAENYPWMKISTKIDFAAMDIEEGNWAYRKTERQFVTKHKLRNKTGGLDTEKTEVVMIEQLGKIFQGYSYLKPHFKIFYAIFAARMNKDFAAADKMLIQGALSAADGKLDYTGVDDLVEKYGKTKKMAKLVATHAYEKTLLMGMLEAARGGEGGKDPLPPNWFLWLKGVDRPLWYALSDMGRQTPGVESAGVYCHWLAEKTFKGRLEMPFVVNAVAGLQVELAKYLNDESEEEEGLSLDDELLAIKPQPPAPKIPSPDEAEAMRRMKRLQHPTPDDDSN